MKGRLLPALRFVELPQRHFDQIRRRWLGTERKTGAAAATKSMAAAGSEKGRLPIPVTAPEHDRHHSGDDNRTSVT